MQIQPTLENWNYWYNKIYGYFYGRVNSKAEVEDLTVETLKIFFLTAENLDHPQAFIFYYSQ